MIVNTTRVRRGNKIYEYLTLVEAARENGKPRHRTLFRLGEVSALQASGELDRMIAALQAHADGGRFESVELDALEAEDAPAGGVAAMWFLWRELGLDRWFAGVGEARNAEVLEHAAFAMVANRLATPRPASKRGLPEWVAWDVAMPEGFCAPSLDQYHRALDAVAESKEATEAQLYSALTDLTNLDLRLCCYDLTSSYVEGSVAPSTRFPSKAFGYKCPYVTNGCSVSRAPCWVAAETVPEPCDVQLGLTTPSDGIQPPALQPGLQKPSGLLGGQSIRPRGLSVLAPVRGIAPRSTRATVNTSTVLTGSPASIASGEITSCICAITG